MAEKWIWLGDAALLDVSGVLAPPTAPSSVFPFLAHDDADPDNPYELRLLVRKEAAAVLGWFGVLGKVDATRGPNLTDWTTITLPDAWRWKGLTTATFGNAPEAFNPPGDLAISGPAVAAVIGILEVSAQAPVITTATFSVGVGLKVAPSKDPKHFVTDGIVTAFPIQLVLEGGALTVDDTPVAGDDGDAIDIELGTAGSKLRLRSFDDLSGSGKRIGVEIPVPLNVRTSVPIQRAGAALTFMWKSTEFLVRLHIGQGAGSAADLIADVVVADNGNTACSVEFVLPLVESPAAVDRPDSTPRLLLTKSTLASAEQSFETFRFVVELSAEVGDAGKPILRFKLDGSTYVAELADTIDFVRGLPGKFQEHVGNFERVLTSVFGMVDGLKADSEAVSFTIKKLTNDFNEAEAVFKSLKAKLDDFPVPLQLNVTLGDRTWVFIALARLDLWNGRLKDNRIFVSAVPLGNAKTRTIDLSVFALVTPEPIDLTVFSKQLKDLFTAAPGVSVDFETLDRDGFLDVARGELILDFKREKSDSSRAVKLVFPGDLADGDTKYSDRVVLRTEAFDPDNWPNKVDGPGSRVHLRLGSRGLSVMARVDTGHAAELDIGAEPGLRLSLERERGELRSELVVVNNQVRLGTLVGKLDGPGFKKLQFDLLLGLRQTDATKPPTIFAQLDLSRPRAQHLLEMTVPGLRGRVDAVHLELAWNGSEWDADLTADGSISFLGFGKTGGMQGLDNPDMLPFQNLDLLEFRKGKFEIPLRRTREKGTSDVAEAPASGTVGVGHWEVLNGLIAVECTDVTLTVDFADITTGKLKSATLTVKRPRLEFHGGTSVDVAVETDELKLSWSGRDKLALSFSGLIGFEMRIGPNIAFEGKGGWTDNPQEHYFSAFGALRCSGFPNIEATIKLGSGKKKNGNNVPNIVVYGSFDFEADLFPGVVLKRVGAGLSINNRLAALGRDPEPREILAKLEQVRPEVVENWRFDPEGGLYVALIASAWAASSRGGDTAVNAYAMALTMIVDTNLDVVAAGEVWLFSSLRKIREPSKRSRPAMAGVLVFRPRKKTLSFVAETRPNPFIEANDQLAKVLSQCTARFSFYISEDLVDYFLEEVSYQESFLGVDVRATGGYRIAIGRFGVLLRAWLHLQGELPKRKLEQRGVGGFEFRGNLFLDADFGGLIASDGVSAYGSIAAGLTFRVSAFVMVPTPRMEMRRYKKTISFTVSYPTIKCGRWSCRTKWHDETIEETIIVDIPELVIRNEPYRLPETGIELFLAGDVGFDSGGQIGFRGTISIDVNILGHSLSISPKLDVQGKIVDKVKRRVAAVEASVNELRNLPRPAPADDGEVTAPPTEQKWTLYEKKVGDKKWCVIVPSAGQGNEAWYAPMLADLGADYATFPRDTTRAVNPLDGGAASEIERLHLTPLRDTVVRMIIPIKADEDDAAPNRLLDLVMPWDRANMDALPDPPGLDQDEKAASAARLRALKKVNQIEAEMTAGAVENSAFVVVNNELGRRRSDQEGITVVRDPRIGSNDRRFWDLVDQLERPDWAPPAEFRPVSELTALGIAPPPHRGSGDASLQAVFDYDRLRVQGLRAVQHEAGSPTEATRILQTRASFLASVLNDFEQFPGPNSESHYATNAYDDPARPSRQMLIERKLADGSRVSPNDPQQERAITRRRLPFICHPVSPGKYEFRLVRELLSGVTNFVFGDDNIPFDAKFEVTWDPDTLGEHIETLDAAELKREYVSDDVNPVQKFARVKLLDIPPGYNGVTEDFLFIELHPTYAAGVERKIGLIFELKATESVDLAGVRIVRNPEKSDELAEDFTKWFDIRKPNLVRTVRNEERSATDLHRTVIPLTPCQTFVPTPTPENGDGPGAFPTKGRLVVRLPVLFTDEFFTRFFAGVNRFEVLRKFDWEQAPVSLGEYPFGAIRWSAGGERYVMPRTFLASDEFDVDGTSGSWNFVDPRIRPGTPIVQYFLRAIPFGESARSIDQVLPVRWPSKVALYLPERREPLPPLAVIFEAGSLMESETGAVQLKFAIFDARGVRFAKRSPAAKDQEKVKLELWVKPERITSSGYYAPGDELTPEVSRAAANIRVPSDLPTAPLPEDTDRKYLFGSITFGSDDVTVDSESSRFEKGVFKLRPGFRYRWYVRPKADLLNRRVVPLEQYVAREIPESVDQNTRLLAVDGLEIVSKNERRRILAPLGIFPRDPEQTLRWHTRASMEFELLKELPCRGDLSADEQKLLAKPTRVYWETLDDALDGGVELIFQDSFNSSRVDRRQIEVHGEAVFARSQTDFRLAGYWQAHSRHDSGRLWQPEPQPRIVVQANDLWHYFVWTSSFNPLLSRLEKARADVIEVLGDVFSSASSNADWRTLHQAIANWFAAINMYFQSPLVQDAAAEEVRVDLLFARVRNLFLGLPEPVPSESGSAVTLNDYENQMAVVREAMDSIDRNDPSREAISDVAGNEAEIFKQRLLDHEIASRLAEVIRGRLQIVDALREFTSGGTADLPEADDVAFEIWPRYGEWTTHATRWIKDVAVPATATMRPLSDALLRPFQVTTALLRELDLYNQASKPVFAETQPKGFFTNLELLGLAITKTGVEEEHCLKIGETAARRVNEAAGLAAAIAGIRAVAEPRGWRLVRRPHHQLAPEGAAGTETGEKDSLSNYISLLTRAADPQAFANVPDPTPAEGVIHYFNWLERMGFAVDLALVDEDNRYFAQRELIGQLYALDWSRLLDDVAPLPGAGYRVYILAGREPDTVLPLVDGVRFVDDDDALGYSFVKLAVVPIDLLRDLSATSAVVTVSGINGSKITVSDGPLPTRFGQVPADRTLIVTRVEPASAATAVHNMLADIEVLDASGKVLTIALASSIAINIGDKLRLEPKVPVDLRKTFLLKWFELRGLEIPVDPEERLTKLLVSLAMGADKLALVELNHTKLIVVEPWGRRWQTVPSIGSWSHISHPVVDRSGRVTLLAGRRVSRYEPFLRWLKASDLPRVERLTGLGDECIVPITHRRRLLEKEEPRTLPVAVHPHPSRIEFLYRLPPSAARALLSAEARRRTGFLECQVAFTSNPPLALKNQVFPTALLPAAVPFNIPVTAAAGDELSIDPIDGKTLALLIGSIMLWPASAPTEVAFIASASDDPANGKCKIKLNRSIPIVPAPIRALSIKPPNDQASVNPLCPQVKFVQEDLGSGHVELRILGGLDVESMLGSPAIISDDSNPGFRDAVFIKQYDPVRRVATLMPNSTITKGSLNVIRWESLSEAYPLPVAVGTDPIELFRHERLISLGGLPYYLEYRAGVEARFAADPAEDPAPGPEKSGLSTIACRQPGWIPARPPRITANAIAGTLEVTLFLNRLGDALDPREREEARRLDFAGHSHTIAGEKNILSTRHLLDVDAAYQLWIELPPSPADADAELSITKVADIVLSRDVEKPVATVTVFHQIKINGVVTPDKVDVKVSPFIPEAAPVYWINFVLQVDSAVESVRNILKDPGAYRLMAMRSGYESPMLKAHTEAPAGA